MDNQKSVWIWADPIPKSKCIWTSMNINNNRESLAIANDYLITSPTPLVFLYFHKILFCCFRCLFPNFVLKYKKTRGEYKVIRKSLAIVNDPRLLLMFIEV